jgi:hypothetical protein
MPVTNVKSQWVGGNLRFVLASDLSKVVNGIVAVAGSTTKAGGTLVVPITGRVCLMTTSGAEALTLANGAPGQVLVLTLVATGGDGTLTPATCTGFATLKFHTVKDTVTLLYIDDTIGWVILGCIGTTVGAFPYTT